MCESEKCNEADSVTPEMTTKKGMKITFRRPSQLAETQIAKIKYLPILKNEDPEKDIAPSRLTKKSK
jgi:hypothetical protein